MVPSTADRLLAALRAALAEEAGPGHVFKVASPADEAVLEQVDDCRDVLGNGNEVVVVEAKVVSADGGDVVRLRRMCEAVVFGEKDALFFEFLDYGIAVDFVVVLVILLAYDQPSHFLNPAHCPASLL